MPRLPCCLVDLVELHGPKRPRWLHRLLHAVVRRWVCARRQEANKKAEAIKHLKAELTSVKERAEQVQMEKERKVRAATASACPSFGFFWPYSARGNRCMRMACYS